RAARQRFIVKAFSLLIEPDVAGRETEDQTAAPLGVAIIRRSINVKPDVIHMREVATQLANHFVTRARCAEARAFHDLEGLELRPMLQDPVESRIKAPRSGYEAPCRDALMPIRPRRRPVPSPGSPRTRCRACQPEPARPVTACRRCSPPRRERPRFRHGNLLALIRPLCGRPGRRQSPRQC